MNFQSDPAISAFVETSGLSFKSGASTSIAFSFTTQNAASSSAGNGNDILIASGSNYNYEFAIQLSDVDMATGTDTLNIADIAISSSVDRQQALAATANFVSTGTASVTIPSAQCSSIGYLCLQLAIPSTAKYKDTDTTNNAKCVDISTGLSCSPGQCSECYIVIYVAVSLKLYMCI